MSDRKDPFEIELKARLAVDPSRDLQARIRSCTVEAPEKRRLWIHASLGLAATAAVVLLAVYIQPDRATHPQPSATPGAKLPLPAAVSPEVARPSQVKAANGVRTIPPTAVAEIITIPEATNELTPEPLEVPALTGIELRAELTRIPQNAVPFTASIEPINLEPLALTVRNLGVNE